MYFEKNYACISHVYTVNYSTLLAKKYTSKPTEPPYSEKRNFMERRQKCILKSLFHVFFDLNRIYFSNLNIKIVFMIDSKPYKYVGNVP